MTLLQRVSELLKFLGFLGFLGAGAVGIAFGGMLIFAALDGAHIIPNLFLVPGTDYDAYKAVVVLLVGEVLLVGGIDLFWRAASGKLD